MSNTCCDTCWDCGGDGYTHHDCGEDCCACMEPEPNVRCTTCGGRGRLPVSTEDR